MRTLAPPVEQTGPTRFRGTCHEGVPGRTYGGQLVAHALSAAQRKLPDTLDADSLHCYFLRPGQPGEPVDYDVVPVRDGRTYAVRQVTASQRDKIVLTFTASFPRQSHCIRLPRPGHRERVEPGRAPGGGHRAGGHVAAHPDPQEVSDHA